MGTATRTIRFKARLLRPAEPKRATWSFLVLPRSASSRLPSRGMVAVEGSINGSPFKATLDPDSKGSHWLKVPKKVRDAARAAIGDTVELEMTVASKEPEPGVPADLRKALASAPAARAVWSDITPAARRDWIKWIVTARKAETRARRIASACDMLRSGKRRVCCFDRSGIYSKGPGAPKAADRTRE